MSNLSFVHYYFGDREKAFLVGLGTILRAKGHSKPVLVILIDDPFSLAIDLEKENIPHILIESEGEKDNIMKTFLDVFNGLKDTVCLIANFDTLINSKNISLPHLIQILQDLDTSNEYVLTSEKYFKELEEFADYVSSVQEL